MNAPLNTHAMSAVKVAEWKAQAALSGQTFAQVACAAMRDRLSGRKALLSAGDAWLAMSDRTRLILLSMATDRDKVERVRWDQLSEGEQMRVGALARSMMHELNANARVLRA